MIVSFHAAPKRAARRRVRIRARNRLRRAVEIVLWPLRFVAALGAALTQEFYREAQE